MLINIFLLLFLTSFVFYSLFFFFFFLRLGGVGSGGGKEKYLVIINKEPYHPNFESWTEPLLLLAGWLTLLFFNGSYILLSLKAQTWFISPRLTYRDWVWKRAPVGCHTARVHSGRRALSIKGLTFYESFLIRDKVLKV